MRRMRLLLLVVSLLCGAGWALATARLDLKVSVGYDGYYRTKTVVPIAVQVRNDGDSIRGDLRVTSQLTGAIRDRYRYPIHIPKGANQLLFLYVIPERFTSDITVECWRDGQLVTSTTKTQCKELYPSDRLMVVVGGAGSSLSYVNGQPISVPGYPAPSHWDLSGQGYYQEQLAYSGARGAQSGNVRQVYVDSALLPDNPEAYGGISLLALMSDVTENTLQPGAQAALPLWVANGGHVLVAGGGAANRLDAPFFRGLLPGAGSSTEQLTNADGGRALSAPYAAGRVTWLQYDPDLQTLGNWQKVSQFYGKLVARASRPTLAAALREKLNDVVMVRNLRPPDFKMIVIFLLVYLVMLVPVNYFVLKRIDRRELAWLTTPAIVLVFTIGAYGIGYLTKGHRLIVNAINLVEVVDGQTSAAALTETLIFSPSSTNYRMDMGKEALLVREVEMGQSDYYDGSSYEERKSVPLSVTASRERMQVENVRVDMWAFRQFVSMHRLDLGQGFSARLRNGAPSSTPRATGTVTNGTPYAFAVCELYVDGALVATFAMNPGETVTVERAQSVANPRLSEDELHMVKTLRPAVKELFNTGHPLDTGFVLVGYTNATEPSVRLNTHQPSTNMTILVAHLRGPKS